MTDAAGCTLRWNESTHYVRAIAVFKISLTLCVLSICRAFGQKGGKPWGRRGRLISSDLQTLRSLVTFSQAETQEDAGYTLCFFTPAFSLRFFLHVHTEAHTHSKPARQAGSAPPFFSLTHWSAHTQTHPMHAYTHPGSPWLLNCHCSEITASRTRQLGLRAGISYKPSSSAVRYFKCRQMGRELRELDYVWMYFCYFD